MGIEEQLRQLARSLRDRGVPRDEAVRIIAQRRSELERSQAAQEPRDTEDRGEGLSASQRARLLAQGATFGFGEEIEAGARALGALVPGGRSPREAYRETVEGAREDIAKAYEDRPLESFATEMAGGFAPALLTLGGSTPATAASATGASARALRAARTASRASAARPVVGGAVEGAISGAGAGEGTVGRGAGALFGAGIGAATGGLLGGVGWAGRRAKEFLENRKLQSQAAEIAAKARAAGIPMSNDQAFAELVAERRPEIPTRAALERVEQALLEQGIEPRKASEFARPGQTVMELGIPESERLALEAGTLSMPLAATPLQRLARGTSILGGQPATSVERRISERLIDAPERIKGELTRRSLGERSPYFQALDNLTEIRKSNASELYGAAYAQSVPASRFRDLISRPAEDNWFVDAYSSLQDLARREVRAGVEGAELLPAVFQQVADKSGRPVIRPIDTAEIPVQALDRIKRTLDQNIDNLIGTNEISSGDARLLRFELDQMLDVVDAEVPEFAQARRIFKSDKANAEALDAAYKGGTVNIGGEQFKMRPFVEEKPAVIRRFLENESVSEAEKQSYITGALDAILSKVEGPSGGDGRDLTRELLGNEAVRQRVRVLLGSKENFDAFLDAVLPERALTTLRARALGGSSTAAAVQDVAAQRLGESATAVATGQPMLGARIAVGDIIDNAVRKFTERMRGKAERATVAELLTMEPRSFEEFYTNVYDPMMEGRGFGRILREAEQSGRRALGGTLSRILGREFR